MLKKRNHFMLACVLFFILIGCSTTPTEEEAAKKAIELFESFQTENIESVIDSFGQQKWQENVSVETLEGDIYLRGEDLFESFTVDEIKQIKDGQTIVDGHITSPKATSDVRLILTKKLAVSSMEFQTPVALLSFPNTIIEEDITIGEGTEFPLGGKLTVPKDEPNKLPVVPVVILVHGSGATDYDESAYAYKPFRDIAWGLAQRGIASIRYDKRTFVYGNEGFTEGIEKMNVREETINDALKAVDVLLSDTRIDREEIYVVGHSLGGMLAPRIAQASDDVAGIISLAGSPRSLTEIILDQQQLFLEEQSVPETVQAQQQVAIDELHKEVEETLALSKEEILSTQLLGMPAYYLWEMNEHPVEEILPSLHIPMYIMQGDKDFQVFKEKDYAAWKTLLEDKEDVTFSSYPKLNHFFVEHHEETDISLDAYTYPATVSEEVIDDIATWIHEQ